MQKGNAYQNGQQEIGRYRLRSETKESWDQDHYIQKLKKDLYLSFLMTIHEGVVINVVSCLKLCKCQGTYSETYVAKM